MAATVQASRFAPPNHRRRVRHKIHAPAYATFIATSKGEMLDLYEIVDISEVGVAIQCATSSALQPEQRVDLCLDLAEASGSIYVTAHVVWSDASGRTGFSLPALPDSLVRRLREWLFLNAMAAAANAAAFGVAPGPPVEAAPKHSEPIPTRTDLLTAAAAVQSEADSLGDNLVAVLALIAERSQSLLRASGAAIAMVGQDVETMICRACVGESAPPEGASLQVGVGFSGECVRTAKTLRCDDAETDDRVDPETCRALGIRSILAVPIISGDKSIGLLEVFSERPRAFAENESAVLQAFAETVLAAVRRAIQANQPAVAEPPPFSPQGSVLFASEVSEGKKSARRKEAEPGSDRKQPAVADPNNFAGIRLPRLHLWLLVAAAATIFMVLGFASAPWIQPWVQKKFQGRQRISSVLASSQVPTETSAALKPAAAQPSVDSANFEQLQQLAQQGNPAAENALGLIYAQGDEKQAVKKDETEAFRWFTKAAEQNYVGAQSKLGALYWGGRGVTASLNQAYFWTVLARAGGDQGSKTLAPILAAHMTRAQAAAIEQQAEMWYQQHQSPAEAQAGH
jgi:GAF domain-containing protein